PVGLSELDKDRLATEFATFLRSIRPQLDDQIRSDPSVNVEALRSSAIQRIRNWGSYMGSEGTWLRYVERVRPGTQKLLFAEAAPSALQEISYQPLAVINLI